MVSVHFEFERFEDVHVLWRRRERLGAAGAVFMSAHDDGRPDLRRRCGEEEARQLAAGALVALFLTFRVGWLRGHQSNRWVSGLADAFLQLDLRDKDGRT